MLAPPPAPSDDVDLHPEDSIFSFAAPAAEAAATAARSPSPCPDCVLQALADRHGWAVVWDSDCMEELDTHDGLQAIIIPAEDVEV